MENLKIHNPDGVLVNEPGLNWSKLPVSEGWSERAYKAGIQRCNPRFSYNIHDESGEQVQWGGTGVLLFDDFRTRQHGKMGSDPENLGRWTWARVQGREGKFLRLISGYKPVKNTTDEGSVYQQQLRYFRSRGTFEDPRTLFDLHLKHQLQEWLQEGDQIILGLDANEDVRNGPVRTMLHELGMKEAILSLNRPHQPPETNSKNNQRKPSDAIFTTAGIQPTQGGYTAYNTIMASDHRALWLDIPRTSTLGFNPPNLHKHEIRPVKASDPRSVNTYNKWVREGYKREHDMVPKNIALLKKL